MTHGLIAFLTAAVSGFSVVMAADVLPDASGFAGWSTAAVTGGLATALMFILRWLVNVHIPNLDRQREELLAAHLKAMDDKDKSNTEFTRRQREDHVAALKGQSIAFQESLAVVVAHCEKESARATDVLKGGLSEVAAAETDLRETMEHLRDFLLNQGAGRQPRRQPEA